MLNSYLKDQEFLDKVNETVYPGPFDRLKETKHHNDSIYIHTMRVSYKAWRMGKKRKKIDMKELLRGALFHDLYFHNWRDKQYIGNHGWTHPRIAAKNAEQYYGPLSEKEQNIISSHMWPFNFTNPPRFREAFILSFSDKWIATAEVFLMIAEPVLALFQRNKADNKAK